MKLLDHGPECDGYRVIVDVDGERMRLHAPKEPKDVKAWASEAVRAVLDARKAEAAVKPVEPAEDAVEVVKKRLVAAGQSQLAEQVAMALSVRGR